MRKKTGRPGVPLHEEKYFNEPSYGTQRNLPIYYTKADKPSPSARPVSNPYGHMNSIQVSSQQNSLLNNAAYLGQEDARDVNDITTRRSVSNIYLYT